MRPGRVVMLEEKFISHHRLYVRKPSNFAIQLANSNDIVPTKFQTNLTHACESVNLTLECAFLNHLEARK